MGKAIITTIIVLILVAGAIFLFIRTPAEEVSEEELNVPGITTEGGEEVEDAEEGVEQEQEETVDEEEVSVAEEPAEEPEQEVIREFNVSGSEFSFNPSSITVRAGQEVRVTFTNTGSNPHDFVIEGLGIRTNVIGPGQTDTVEFTAPASGTYTFYCSVAGHREAGMVGSLIVE